jgi:hypothetical protein
MPRDGATIFSDLIGKLDLLRVRCEKYGRDGCYGLSHLINKRGRNAKVIDWLDEITADCPKKSAHNMNDRCGARCPDLPRGQGSGLVSGVLPLGFFTSRLISRQVISSV